MELSGNCNIFSDKYDLQISGIHCIVHNPFKVLSERPSIPTDYRFFRKADCIKFFAGSMVLATDTEYQNMTKIQNGGPMCRQTVTAGQVSGVQFVKLITQRDKRVTANIYLHKYIVLIQMQTLILLFDFMLEN